MSDKNQEKVAAEIEKTLTNQMKGYRSRDVSCWESVYTDDTDWTNAFGVSLTGGDEIMEYMKGLFDDKRDLGPRNFVQEPQFDIRMVGEGVCIVRTYIEIQDQNVSDDKTINRHNFSQKVLIRQPDGHWPIISEIYMDAHAGDSYREASEIGLNKTRF